MPHDDLPEAPTMPKEFLIRELDDGSFLLRISGGGMKDSEEYSYETKDELLSDISDDLGEGESQDNTSDEPKNKKSKDMAMKVTDMEESQ